MILAVLDDLMFSSKIKTAAKQLGVTVSFARSADAALSEMRKTTPALVILDLNNARTTPLEIVAAMKNDPALASIPTLGYASHVQTDVIEAARRAGVGDVLARSAFTMQLGEILSIDRPRAKGEWSAFWTSFVRVGASRRTCGGRRSSHRPGCPRWPARRSR